MKCFYQSVSPPMKFPNNQIFTVTGGGFTIWGSLAVSESLGDWSCLTARYTETYCTLGMLNNAWTWRATAYISSLETLKSSHQAGSSGSGSCRPGVAQPPVAPCYLVSPERSWTIAVQGQHQVQRRQREGRGQVTNSRQGREEGFFKILHHPQV